MARGGSRPGSGRPRLTDEEKAQRIEARKLKRKAARKPAAKKTAKKTKRAPVAYAPEGVKQPDAPPAWPFGTEQAEPEQPPAAEAESGEPVITADTPLALLLGVVKESRLKLSLRMQAAALAAPFVHAKPAPLGKKEQREEAAKGSGRFKATAAPPRLVHSAR